METIPGSLSELPSPSGVVTSDDDGRASQNLIIDNELPSSVHAVVYDDDLLIEILIRLPILSLLFFKSVSKHWLSLIRGINSTLCRTQNLKLDLPSGFFIRRYESPFGYDFLPLDLRIPSRIYPLPSNFIFCLDSEMQFRIEDSCNGLLLCDIVTSNGMPPWEDKCCIYNPSLNMFKILPKFHDLNVDFGKPVIKMAFDPRISPYYKLVVTAFVDGYNEIETYSSETGNWSVCGDRFPYEYFYYFQWGINFSHAIHWLDTEHHFKLDIINEHPVITKTQQPLTLKGNVCDRKLFDSHGCLLLLGLDYFHSQQLNIYEMSNGSSEWSMKYIVNCDDIIVPFPKRWSMRCSVWCIVLGKREEDSFMVIELDNRVVEYKILSKNLRTLYDEETYPYDYVFRGYQFFASLAGV